jgi:hypothetical protein
MTIQTSALELLNRWYHEAASEFGDDWPRIQHFLHAKLSQLPEQERISITQSISLVLAEPDREWH